MQHRLTKLSFIIGLFFFIVAAILLLGYFMSDVLASSLNLYAGIVFLIFGVAMMLVKERLRQG